MPQANGNQDFEIADFKGANPLWMAWWLWAPPKTRDAWQTRWFEVGL